MLTNRLRWLLGAGLLLAAGCEGYNRDYAPPTNLNKTPEQTARDIKGVRLADELEKMNELRREFIDQLAALENNATGDVPKMTQARTDYLAQLGRLERVYLEMGDMARSNWARRQRVETERAADMHPARGRKPAPPNWAEQRREVEAVTVYPFGSEHPPEYAETVRPIRADADADRLYTKAEMLIESFRFMPLAGALDVNKEKARDAIKMLRELLVRYPTSDKVDDAAFWIGECYKEYLREEDTDNKLALMYYNWAIALDPKTPHPARFQAAVVYDFRLHDRRNALAMYHRVIDEHENYHFTNPRFAAERIKQLSDDDHSKERPIEEAEPSRMAQTAEPSAEPSEGRTP